MIDETKDPTLEKIRGHVEETRRQLDETARGARHDIDEGRVRESLLPEANQVADGAARGVEVCDAVTKKLDEVEEDFS